MWAAVPVTLLEATETRSLNNRFEQDITMGGFRATIVAVKKLILHIPSVFVALGT